MSTFEPRVVCIDRKTLHSLLFLANMSTLILGSSVIPLWIQTITPLSLGSKFYFLSLLPNHSVLFRLSSTNYKALNFTLHNENTYTRGCKSLASMLIISLSFHSPSIIHYSLPTFNILYQSFISNDILSLSQIHYLFEFHTYFWANNQCLPLNQELCFVYLLCRLILAIPFTFWPICQFSSLVQIYLPYGFE